MSNPISGPSTSTNPASVLAPLDLALQEIIYELKGLIQIDGDGRNDKILPLHLNARVDELLLSFVTNQIRHLQHIASLSSALPDDLLIPKAILQTVDQGRNPHQWTQQALKNTLAENQLQKGKVEALKSYKSSYANALVESFPELSQLLKDEPVAAGLVKQEGKGSGDKDEAESKHDAMVVDV